MGRWSWILTRVIRKIWFRAAIISAVSVGLAMLAAIVTRYLPYSWGLQIGQNSVGTILQILASSMLAVTTFSLTAMVSAYSSATQLATPRATQLMVSDPTSQNALSTFLGAFVFSIVGIIGLQTSAYGDEGRIILFGATVLVTLLVVVTLLRWIGHITAFGRMGDVIDRVEDAAAEAMANFAAQPDLRGRPAIPVPASAVPVMGDQTGYIAHIDVGALGKIAARCSLVIHVVVLPGTMVHPERELMRVEGSVDANTREALVTAFSTERHRSFDQDPRLGLIALSEIASRALSPAVNDPGTAIEVLNALLRVFLRLRTDGQPAMPGPDPPPVYLLRPSMDDMLVDAFRPIMRESGAEVEVLLRLTSTLAALHAGLPQARTQIRAVADQCTRRASRSLEDPDDLAAFERAHRRLWPDTIPPSAS